jgi:hypothetical protein
VLLRHEPEIADNKAVGEHRRASHRGLAAVAFVVACLALAVVALCFVIAARGIGQQRATRSWVPTPAVVTGTTPFRASGLLVARPMTYEYRVGGVLQRGNRYCYGVGLLASRRGERNRLMWTPGTRITAFVDPQNPSRAVLDNTLHGYHLLPLPAGLPFLLLGVSCTIAGVRWLQRKQHRVAGGLLLSDSGREARIELRPVFPKWGVASGGFAAWVLVMALLVYGFDLDPPVWAVGAGCALILVGGLARYLWLVAVRRRGEGALIVDRSAREMRLPLELAEFYGRPAIRFDDIEAIEAHDASTLGDDLKLGRYVVKIRPHGCNHIRSLSVRRTDNQVEAHDLATWLRKQALGV